MKSGQMYRFFLIVLMGFCLVFGGCASSDSPTSDIDSGKTPSPAATQKKGTRDNTPEVLSASADGTKTFTADTAIVDISHIEDGYFMAQYTGSNAKPKLQLTGPDNVTYTYNLRTTVDTFPLTAGNGTYQVGVYENISGTKYATVLSETFKVSIADAFTPYLYPNQYVNFTKDSLPVAKAKELAAGADSDLDVVSAVYNYIITTFTYDYSKASSVQSGYLPDIDKVFQEQKGICFDYAAVMACMLRSQKIPTRLEVGYMQDQYHAWISIYLSDKGWINGVIQFHGDTWQMLDPTFASTSSTPEDFVAKTDQYTTKYIY